MGRTANPDLTYIEFFVLQRFSEGQRTLEIADDLGIGKKAVEHHMNMVRKKLGATTIANAVFIGCKNGMLIKEEIHG